MSGITPAQYRALTFIRQYIAANGYSPNYREIADGVGVKSPSEAHRLVHLLAERGSLTVRPRCSRSIELVRAA